MFLLFYAATSSCYFFFNRNLNAGIFHFIFSFNFFLALAFFVSSSLFHFLPAGFIAAIRNMCIFVVKMFCFV